jgi:hypothetical protein
VVNERIQAIVRAKGKAAALSVCIDTALEGESAILSVKERGFRPQKFNKGPEVDNRATSNHGNVNKESGRGFGFANRGNRIRDGMSWTRDRCRRMERRRHHYACSYEDHRYGNYLLCMPREGSY